MEDVPVGAVNRHRYALIIGNEDYSMTGANAEINVPYAVNDAVLFREYCVRSFRGARRTNQGSAECHSRYEARATRVACE